MDKILQQSFKEKLASSGLSPADAKKLKFEIVENPQKLQDHFAAVPAFKIPYTDLKGKPTGFYRLRYLAGTKSGFARATAAKDRRYDQPAFEAPQLYFPACLPPGATWQRVCDDPRLPLIFTEGELKAACAARHGLPTVALGGVWNFKSKKAGLQRLPALNDLALKGRTCFIVFDSDVATNAQVLFAQHKFAEELFNLGANPLVVNLPKVEGKKHGIDDYIVEHGVSAFKDLIKDEQNHREFKFVRELLRLNAEVATVVAPMCVLHLASNQLIDYTKIGRHYANRKMLVPKLAPPPEDSDEKPKLTIREVPVFKEWLEWERRNEVAALVYAPGQSQFIQEGGRRLYNTWQGWGCEPAKGGVAPWLWLLDQVFKNARPEHRRWFEQWCAYPLQHPGTKLYTAAILFGQTKGTGKSLIGLSLKEIYGANGGEITDTQLEDERNVFAAQKQFILANEVTSGDKRKMIGRIRNLITQHEVVINKKYEPDYTVRDTINYLLTSNMVDPVYMEDDERRFFVHEVRGPRLLDVDAAMVGRYDRWLRSGELGPALFHHLLQIDLADFDPTAAAPDTPSKRVMVEASRSEVETWAFKLREDPDTCLRVGDTVVKFSLYRLKDLLDFYARDSDRRFTSEKAFGNALRKAGFDKVARGDSVKTKDGKVNLWLVRFDRYQKLESGAEAAKVYDEERQVAPKKFERERKKHK